MTENTTFVPCRFGFRIAGGTSVTINGKNHYLGPYDSPASHEEYGRLVAEWKRNGHQLLPAMGVATAINFQPSGATTASITGDFALTSGEVEAVAGVLRSNGIDVSAMHQHHLFEQPRLFYMHFWANGDPATLAGGLRAGLDQTNSAAQLAPVAAVGR